MEPAERNASLVNFGTERSAKPKEAIVPKYFEKSPTATELSLDWTIATP
jgi:hypothetical protein